MAYFQYISKLHIYRKDRKKQPKAEKPYVILGCSQSRMISSSSWSSFAWFFCSDFVFTKTLLNASGFFLLFPPFSAHPFKMLKFMPKTWIWKQKHSCQALCVLRALLSLDSCTCICIYEVRTSILVGRWWFDLVLLRGFFPDASNTALTLAFGITAFLLKSSK